MGMLDTTGRSTALILAGAVAKGAFEAGALTVLAEERDRLPITRVVAASAGALNAAVYAAGIRAGREKDAAQGLVQLWREKADWRHVFRWSLSELVQGRGAGTQGDVLELMKEIVRRFEAGRRFPVELCITLTDLQGTIGSIGDEPATTFEHVRRFADEHFDTPGAWENVAKTALGSAALPFLFAPVEVPDVGPCLDGGLVNNTPIKYAIEGGIDQIIVVSAHPVLSPPPGTLRGLDLAGEVIDVLINERLYRDLREALSVNQRLAQLDRLTAEGKLTAAAADTLKEELGWRKLEIVQIRPDRALEGNATSGFSHRERREAYIQAGMQRARAVLEPMRRTSA
jgi:NTE family protein